MTADVLPALRAEVRAAAHRASARRTAAHPAAAHPAAAHAAAGDACDCGTDTSVLADRPDGTVVRHGRTVAKAHAADTDPAGLAARLAVAAHPGLDGILLPPLAPSAVELAGRPVTLWPYGTPVDRDDPDAAPWEAAATLLARLHRTPDSALPPGLPPMRGPAKAARAMARLRAAGPHPAAAPVLRAWSVLPAWARDEAPMPDTRTLCHGDLHLGQLVRARSGAWLLIDIDDLGGGDPAWDLARPAAWFACGLLPPGEWTRFLTAYRGASGPAVPADSDPWPVLDVPARALAAQTAATAITKSVAQGRPLDEVEVSVIDACDRMAVHPPELAGRCGT